MFYNYFVELCNRAKISPSKAAQQIGLSKSSVSGWKNGSVPRDSQIMRIADFFGIPVSDIYSVVIRKEQLFLIGLSLRNIL